MSVSHTTCLTTSLHSVKCWFHWRCSWGCGNFDKLLFAFIFRPGEDAPRSSRPPPRRKKLPRSSRKMVRHKRALRSSLAALHEQSESTQSDPGPALGALTLTSRQRSRRCLPVKKRFVSNIRQRTRTLTSSETTSPFMTTHLCAWTERQTVKTTGNGAPKSPKNL